MSHIPKPQEIYRHFKGNLYQIITIARHSETNENLVIYQALYGDFTIYARPLSMFMEKVDTKKYPQAMQEYRFEPLTKLRLRNEQVEEPQMDAPKFDITEEETDIPKEAVDITKESADSTKEESVIDPLLMEFLDADSYEERLRVLTALHHRITKDMLLTMSVVCDIELKETDVEEMYEELKNCLLTFERFECNRLR